MIFFNKQSKKKYIYSHKRKHRKANAVLIAGRDFYENPSLCAPLLFKWKHLHVTIVLILKLLKYRLYFAITL